MLETTDLRVPNAAERVEHPKGLGPRSARVHQPCGARGHAMPGSPNRIISLLRDPITEPHLRPSEGCVLGAGDPPQASLERQSLQVHHQSQSTPRGVTVRQRGSQARAHTRQGSWRGSGLRGALGPRCLCNLCTVQVLKSCVFALDRRAVTLGGLHAIPIERRACLRSERNVVLRVKTYTCQWRMG